MASDFRSVITETFQQSQTGVNGHRILSTKLKNSYLAVQDTPNENLFFICFTRCVDRLLTANRKDQCAERVIEFLVEFTKLLCPAREDEDEDESYSLQEEKSIQFIERLIERYVDGLKSRLAQVRLRCITLIGSLVPLVPINETLLEDLEQRALKRLVDVDVKVRIQATLLVSRFELTETTSRALSRVMQHDPSPEVRLVAIYNVAHGNRALTELACERVRDPSNQIRLCMYSKVLTTIDFRTLSIASRERIVKAGLNDRDENVRKAASSLIANRWVSMSDNNIELVLRRLDVIGRTEIADLVLSAFLRLRREVIDMLDFGDDFFDHLWVEDCVLLRGFQDFCLKENLTELRETRMPDLAVIANTIERLWQKFEDPLTYESTSNIEEAKDLRLSLPFMVDQLLQIACKYDLYDEASRQRISEVTNMIAMSDSVPSYESIAHIVSIQRRLNSSDTALVSWAFETIEATPSMSTQQQSSDADIVSGLLRALSIFCSVLSHVSSRDVSAYLPSIYNTYIQQALQSPISQIRIIGLRCLGLACLLDYKFAASHISSFTEFVSNNRDKTNNSPDLSEEICLCIHTTNDMLLKHTEPEAHGRSITSENADTSIAGESNHLPRESIVALFVSLLDTTDSAIHSAAALSLAKLTLAKIVDDPSDIIRRLVVYYFSCSDSDDYSDTEIGGLSTEERLGLIQQQLLLFLKAYTLYGDGKLELAGTFLDACREYAAWRAVHPTAVSIGDFVKQFVELTSLEGSDTSHGSAVGNAHAIVAIGIIELFFSTDDANVKRSLVTILGKLELENATEPELTVLRNVLASKGDLGAVRGATNRTALTNFNAKVCELCSQKEVPDMQSREQESEQTNDPKQNNEPEQESLQGQESPQGQASPPEQEPREHEVHHETSQDEQEDQADELHRDIHQSSILIQPL